MINVTSFSGPAGFRVSGGQSHSDLIQKQTLDDTLRIWIAGCSTGEETYSLAMLFREQIALAKRNIKLQVFASDVDVGAVACAREGFYPEAIQADVSPERIARFFTKEERGFRVSSELRSTVLFTVQDVLADPPFSRLDLISCRNLLIYLLPEAQSKVVTLFHFALREGGILLRAMRKRQTMSTAFSRSSRSPNVFIGGSGPAGRDSCNFPGAPSTPCRFRGGRDMTKKR